MNKNINTKTEDILNSLDGVKQASPPDFFYTRLMARMEKNKSLLLPAKKVFYPVYILAVLIIVVLINGAIIYTGTGKNSTVTDNDSEQLQSFAAEYNLGDVSSIYELNDEK